MTRFSKDPSYQVLASGRWRGLRAIIVDTTAGRYESPPAADHRLMLHLSEPVQTVCWSDDLRQDRIQARGAFDLIPAGAPAIWEDAGEARSMSVWISNDLLARAAEGLEMDPARVRLRPALDERDAQIVQLAMVIRSAIEEGDAEDALFFDSIGAALAARLVRQYGFTPPQSARASLSPRRLKAVLDYIEANLEEDLRLHRIADTSGLSVSHFQVLFRRAMGVSVHQYVMRRRVKLALKLLEDGSSPISEIAVASGFCHQSHLARAMRRVLGKTPSEVVRSIERPDRRGATRLSA